MSEINQNLEQSTHKSLQIQSRKHSDMYDVYELEIEKHLKDLLEKMITFLEKFISSQSEVEFVEQKLHDYENMPELININREIFGYLENKVVQKIKSYKAKIKTSGGKVENEAENNNNNQSETISNSGSFGNGEYDKLEKQIQKYESEIRNHIRIEQQLKLYSESLSEKSVNIEKEKQFFETEKNNEIEQLKLQINEMQTNFTKKEEELKEAKQALSKLQEQQEMLNNTIVQNQKNTPNRLSTSNIFDVQSDKNQFQPMLNQNKTFFSKKSKPQANALLSNYDNFMKKKNSFRTFGNISQREGQFPSTKQNQFLNENSQDSKISNLFPQNKIINNILSNSKVNTRQQSYLLNPQQEKQQLLQAQQQTLKYGKQQNQQKDLRSKSYNTIYNNRSELNSFNNNMNNFSQIYRVHPFQKQHSQPKKL